MAQVLTLYLPHVSETFLVDRVVAEACRGRADSGDNARPVGMVLYRGRQVVPQLMEEHPAFITSIPTLRKPEELRKLWHLCFIEEAQLVRVWGLAQEAGLRRSAGRYKCMICACSSGCDCCFCPPFGACRCLWPSAAGTLGSCRLGSH